MESMRHVTQSPNFVVIDFHAESRFLLVRTLLRKFPGSVIHETDDADAAIALARAVPLTAVITHRTFEVEGIDLVRLLRSADPKVPIIMVSGMDRESQALAAGANAFLHYDQWLRIGTVVEQLVLGKTDNRREPHVA
jgi:DNA-binding NarL/FixJ family response regulator